MPVAAFCTDIPEFGDNRVLDADFAAQFPGAAMLPEFRLVLEQRDWKVLTGDVALREVTRGSIDVEDVVVIQEEAASAGQALTARGATPGVILCGESPMYARHFYENLGNYCAPFQHRILFSGAHAAAGGDGVNHPLYFPSFHRGMNVELLPWQERKPIAIVAANKYWRHRGLPWGQRFARAVAERRDRAEFVWLNQHQLHDCRLELISYFTRSGRLDVYGAGWDSIGHLPARWQQELAHTVRADPTVHYADKHRLLGRYRFTFTLENFSYPGYVTEKIIDALVAGSIPVYLGAPDIEDFIPRGAFIDLRDFPSPQDLESHLDVMSEIQACEMVSMGQRFLASPQGQRYSFEDRAAHLASLVQKTR